VFDVNTPLEIEFQLQLNSNHGQSSIRFRRLQVEDFLTKAVLGFVDPELNYTEGMYAHVHSHGHRSLGACRPRRCGTSSFPTD
jgi:hypothetical protein